MPNVGDTVQIGTAMPGVVAYAEVEVTAVSAEIDDDGTPIMTEFQPQRVAYWLDADVDLDIVGGGGLANRLVASPSPDNLTWIDLPNNIRNKVVSTGLAFRRVWSG